MRPYIVHEVHEGVDATINIVSHVQNEILKVLSRTIYSIIVNDKQQQELSDMYDFKWYTQVALQNTGL